MQKNKIILKIEDIMPKKTLSGYEFNIVKEQDILPIRKNNSIIVPNKIVSLEIFIKHSESKFMEVITN